MVCQQRNSNQWWNAVFTDWRELNGYKKLKRRNWFFINIKEDFVGEVCAKCCKIFISKCVSTITRRNFATDARVR